MGGSPGAAYLSVVEPGGLVRTGCSPPPPLRAKWFAGRSARSGSIWLITLTGPVILRRLGARTAVQSVAASSA